MAESKRKEAEEIVRQIEETVPVDHRFALVLRTGEWVLSHYAAMSGDGPVVVILGPPPSDKYHEVSVEQVQQLLEEEQ